MNTLSHIMDRSYGDAFSKLGAAPRARLNTALLEYLFRVKNVNQMTRLFKQLGLAFKQIKDSIVDNGYLVRNVKLWLFYRHCHGPAKGLASRFEIMEQDTRLYRFVSRTLLTAFRSYARRFKCLTLVGFDRSVANVCLQLETWCKKFVFRKMRFLINSQSQEVHDFVTELRVKAVRALMHEYPRLSSALHARNFAKRTMHNHGINLIHLYTTESRNRTMRNEDGTFYNNVVPLHSLTTDADLTQSMDWCMVDARGKKIETVAECGEGLDLKIAVKGLLSTYDGKRRQFIRLLMGHYHRPFSIWLATQHGIKLANDELFDRQPLTYIKYSLQFLEVSQEAGQRFLSRLQRHLAAYAGAN